MGLTTGRKKEEFIQEQNLNMQIRAQYMAQVNAVKRLKELAEFARIVHIETMIHDK